MRNKLQKVCEALGVEATEKVEVSEEQFRASCRGAPAQEVYKTGLQKHVTEKFVEGWFAKLELPLLRSKAGCLDVLCTACGMSM